MSKEKQCECCHEWWYDSDVKENLCPNCYDYFKQLKRQLEEKDKEIERLNTIKNNAIECAYLFKVALSVRQKNLAIQELNNLKEYCTKQFNLWENNYLDETYDNKDIAHAYYDIIFSIQERIKELKGE